MWRNRTDIKNINRGIKNETAGRPAKRHYHEDFGCEKTEKATRRLLKLNEHVAKLCKLSFIMLAGLEIELGEILSRNAELHTVKGLYPGFRDEVLRLAEVQYEQEFPLSADWSSIFECLRGFPILRT